MSVAFAEIKEAARMRDLEEERTKKLRDALTQLIERIEFDPEYRQSVIHYRLDTGVKLASPRGFEPRLPP